MASHEPMERSRSNSESVVSGSSRAAKRMGFVVRRNQDLSTVSESRSVSARAPPPQLPPLLANGIPPNIARLANGTVKQPGRRHHHARGVSHDSVMEASHSSSESNSAPATSTAGANKGEEESDAYFRRLSVLQEQMSPTAMASLSLAAFSSQVVESARSVLFTLSQLVPAVRQFLVFCNDKKVSSTLNGVLYTARLKTDALLKTLEHHDALLSPSAASRRAPPAATAVEPIIHATITCIGSFRHIISLINVNIATLSVHADIRHMRSFFLMSFGALAEVKNAWAKLLPALAECRVPVAAYMSSEAHAISVPSTALTSPEQMPPPALPPQMPLPTPTPLSMPAHAPLSIPPPTPLSMPIPTSLPLATPSIWPSKPAGIITSMSTPISGVASPIVPGNGLFLPAGLFSPMPPTVSTPVNENGPYAFHFSVEPSTSDEELFERINAATQSALNVLTLVHEEVQNAGADTKMRELTSMCDYGLEATNRLRIRLTSIRGADAVERSRFGEDTNAFVKGIISMLEFTKTILNDYPFLNEARPQLSSLTRVTKEVLTVTLKPAEKSEGKMSPER
ncbi:RAM signaling pathway protein-domain-containing protein [Lipomyces arxii]|uniref:RAM signaling pathway protein-domain-containing protein n=1 Tax=Lipomyces arxii TaxID=56418 RepID=UPI0034CD9F2B